MLRANVGLSREISREAQAAGYRVSLDGEIPFGPDDAEGVLDKVAELFHLAEEALRVQIERDSGRTPVAPPHQASSPPAPPAPANGCPNGSSRAAPPVTRPTPHNGRPAPAGTELATPKQQQYLQTLGKRKGLSRTDMDAAVARVVGSPKPTGDLTKREAGAVIDHLTAFEPEAAR